MGTTSDLIEPDAAKAIADGLRNNPVVGSASAATLGKLVPHCTFRRYRRGRTVSREGQSATSVFVLVAGGVRVFHRGPDDAEIVVKLFGAPALFGEADAILEMPWLQSVQTLMPSELIEIPAGAFRSLVRTEPELSSRLVRDLAARLVITTDHARQLAMAPAPARLASYLIDHARLFGEPAAGGDIQITVPLTQTSIGRDLAVSRKTASRLLTEWTRLGWLAPARGSYRIADLQTLMALTPEGRLGIAYRLTETPDPMVEDPCGSTIRRRDRAAS